MPAERMATTASRTTTFPSDQKIGSRNPVAPTWIGATRRVAMRTRITPATDVLAAHEQAALEIGELRRKGIHCHVEEHAGRDGPQVDVVRDSVPEPQEYEARPHENR